MSNGVRRRAIQALAKQKHRYSELIRDTGLIPSTDSGVFNYHLSKLLASKLVAKLNDHYELTPQGELAARYLLKIQDSMRKHPIDRKTTRCAASRKP